jgi:hypothetical protein
LFARLEPDIRTKVAELKAEVEEAEVEAAKRDQGEDETYSCSSENDPTKAERLQHLKMLIDVFDSDLKPMFDLRRDIKEGTLTHIAFKDLWHLFQFGQDVRTNGNESQVYRVIRWTGGRPHNGPPPPPLPPGHYVRSEPNTGNFKVDCIYLDFDGHLYTSGYQRFIIRKYEGEKAIVSLQVFPIVFHPNHVELRRRLTARGDTWLQLTQSDHSVHKHYTGMTLDLPQAYEVSQSAFQLPIYLKSTKAPIRLILRSL